MEEIQNSDQKFIVRERRCLKMPPPYNLEASWKEVILGFLSWVNYTPRQRTGEGLFRRERLKAGQRPALAGGGVSVTGDKLAERLSGEK